MARAVAIAIVVAAIAFAVALGRSWRDNEEHARCGNGFVVRGARCIAAGDRCPPPLVPASDGCQAPELRIAVPETSLAVGSSDWEAEGRVEARSIHVGAFRIDAFEATRGWWARMRNAIDNDAARAASGMSRDEAAAFCASRGGRLPTEEEWTVAAASAANPARRYPWGDTGAVCRRAAWGLSAGPCALAADGPDTVGAHPDGDSLIGLHDVSGNVAEWVAPGESHPELGIAKGGSWQSALASDLRVWARLELEPTAHDPRVGVRCAFPP